MKLRKLRNIVGDVGLPSMDTIETLGECSPGVFEQYKFEVLVVVAVVSPFRSSSPPGMLALAAEGNKTSSLEFLFYYAAVA